MHASRGVSHDIGGAVRRVASCAARAYIGRVHALPLPLVALDRLAFAASALVLAASLGTGAGAQTRPRAAAPDMERWDTAAVPCRRLPATGAARAPGDTVPFADLLHDVRGITRFACPLRAGEPPADVDVVGDSSNVITELRVQAPGAAGPQVLPAHGDEAPPLGLDYLEVQDFDGDGWRDLKLLDWWGATGNLGWEIWRFDPVSRVFARDSALSGLPNVRPLPGGRCWATFSVGGGAGRIFTATRLCRTPDGEIHPVRVEEQQPDSAGTHLIRTVRRRRGDSLVVIRADTVDWRE